MQVEAELDDLGIEDIEGGAAHLRPSSGCFHSQTCQVAHGG